jgi:phosphoglycerol transferase MdoB-like AlkP superfamily enzyme
MNALLRLLRDHQVGTWCKRAAWLILLIGIIRMLMQLYILIPLVSSHFSLSINWQSWLRILDTVLSFGSAILFDFFILYAAGVALNHLVPSIGQDQEDEERIEQEQI